MTKPIIRWTIGPVRPDGFKCLSLSVNSIRQLYDADLVVYHNGLNLDQLELLKTLDVKLIDQANCLQESDKPIGVAWKLYPATTENVHQLFIDNDLIITKKIEGIDQFLKSDTTLMIRGNSRNYGRFERHVPNGLEINSGLFGIPPNFDFKNLMEFYGSNWTENCLNNSRTWDEQGLVATVLSGYKKFQIINDISNCEYELIRSAGMHFIGLNRVFHHRPFKMYCCRFHL